MPSPPKTTSPSISHSSRQRKCCSPERMPTGYLSVGDHARSQLIAMMREVFCGEEPWASYLVSVPSFSLPSLGCFVEFIQQNWYWAALAVSGTLLVITSCVAAVASAPPRRPPSSTREDALVVDVREAGEFAAGHIWIPATSPRPTSKRIGELENSGQACYRLHCRQRRPSRPPHRPGRKRVASVHNLEGGIGAWGRLECRSVAGRNNHAAQNPDVLHRCLPLLRACRVCCAARGRHRDRRSASIPTRDEMMARTGRAPSSDLHRRLPRGGCDDLFALDHDGKLDAL